MTCCAVVCAACAGCSGKSSALPPEGKAQAVVVDIAQVTVRSDLADVGAVGSIRARQQALLRFASNGQIERVQFEDGKLVHTGDILVQLDARKEQAQLREALAERDQMRRVAKRAEELAARQLISQADFERSASELETTEAKVAEARAALRQTRIVAPFSGVIGLRDISVGDYASVGQTAAEVIDARVMYVDFRLPESRLPDVAPGQGVTLSVDSYPDDQFKGEIIALSPQVEVSGRSVVVRARIDNAGGRLRPGQLARVRIRSAGAAALLAVPEAAIWLASDAPTVFRVSAGVAKSTPVKIGRRAHGFVEVTEGLSPNDKVVISGHQKISDGRVVVAADDQDHNARATTVN